MVRMKHRPGLAAASLALTAVLCMVGYAQAEGKWGTVKGRIAFDGPVPENPKANVDKDKVHCLSKGDILKNELVVNKKNKGVRWAIVWLTGVDDPKSTKPIPIHESLKNPPKEVVIDQPCCVFEPRMLGMQEGQKLIIKNSSEIAHNSNLQGGADGPNVNPVIPAKSQYEVKEKVRARRMPFSYSCSIHAWMKGWIGVFHHPYFAVTDADGNFTIKNAPAGKYRLMAWHELGWVIINPENLLDRGKVITIKPDGVTDVGTIKFTPPKD